MAAFLLFRLAYISWISSLPSIAEFNIMFYLYLTFCIRVTLTTSERMRYFALYFSKLLFLRVVTWVKQ